MDEIVLTIGTNGVSFVKKLNQNSGKFMKINYTHYLQALVLAFVFAVTAGSCSDSASSDPDDEQGDLLEEVIAATNAYNSTESAITAGYVPDYHCVENPGAGGMGFHWVNEDLVDTNFNPLEPEALLYEADSNGDLHLVGVEYIVINTGQEHPKFGDHPFDVGGTPLPVDHWSLHVWLYKENPDGLFTPFNPDVSCQYAAEVLINEVKEVTQDYHEVDNAMADGWDNVMSPCVEHPEEGGMGYHYGRMEFFDGRINHTEPQVLLYEPLEDGNLEFVGVEYIIPFEIHPESAEPPVLFGESYHQNHELGIWALHVWTEKENPNGIFYDWNPNVSCQFAEENE
jgi:hypothetical protein